MKARYLLPPAMLIAVSLHAQTLLLSENFESQTPGATVSATTLIQDGSTRLAQIVTGSANTAGGGVGNGLRIFDNSSASGSSGATAIEYNLVADASAQVSTLHLSFDIAWNGDAATGDTNDYFTFGVGQYLATGTLSANATRLVSANLYENGTYRWNGTANSGTVSFGGSTAPVSFDLYVNDHNTESITFLAPTGASYTLGADSYVVFIEGTDFHTAALSNLATIAATDAGIGRISFYSTSASAGPDFIVDNLLATTIAPYSAIPEPSTVALLIGGGVLGAAVVIRRRQRA